MTVKLPERRCHRDRQLGFAGLAALVAAVSLLACDAAPTDPIGLIDLPQGDVAAFVRDVQPVAGVMCGSLDCHGDPGRPMRLYAARGLRLTDALRHMPLADEEAAHNAASVAGVSPSGAPLAAHLALAKPLAVAAGGVDHVGPAVWSATSDAGYVCLRAWLEGTSDDPDVQVACQAARDVAEALSPP